MSIVETLCSLAHRGYSFEVRGERLHVDPVPDAVTIAQLRAQKPELLSYIAEHGGRWPQPDLADVHAYVVSHTLDRHGENYGVCISCGVPWELHGQPSFETWRVVADVESVPLISAASIVAATVADQIGKLSAGGQLCPRCQRIARVHDGGVCTFCVAADSE
jgi:hypothetical protein